MPRIYQQNRLVAVISSIAICGLVASLLLAVHLDLSGRAERAALSAMQTPPPSPTVLRPFAVFIGDSYTAGTGATSESARFATLVAHHQNWAFQNLGQGGTGYATNAARGEGACGSERCRAYGGLLDALEKLQPDIIMVAGGRNDLGKPNPDLPAKILRFYRDLKQVLPSARVYAVSPIWSAEPAPDRLYEMRDAVADAAAETGATYLDIGLPLENEPRYLTFDEVHPNDAGHGAIAAAIDGALAERLGADTAGAQRASAASAATE